MNKILITGGAGFIGSNVTELFCDKGFDVTVLDDLSFGYKSFVDKRAKFIEGSISDANLLKKALTGIDAVVHLAASSIIQFSFTNPVGYYENNVLNGIKLLEAMKKKGVKKIIFSSTAAVYGEPKNVPVKESDEKDPMTIYGSSKLAFERLLYVYYKNYGIDSVSLRFYNAYGPRDNQKPATRAIPMWIDDILHRRVVEWYWQGSQLRDYVYVEDIALAIIDVLKLKGCNIFNIGSGNGILMKDVLKILEEIVGKKMKTKDLGPRKGDPMKLVADISKIEKEVGWKPKTSLREGLEKTLAYYASSLK